MNASAGLGRRGRVLFSAIGLLGITAGCDLSAPPLMLDVGRDSAALWVRNQDAEPLANCRVVLNGNWVVTGVQLRPELTEQIAADRFGLPAGRRLDELGSRPTVAVTCHEPQFRSGTFLLDR
jgi:hypothetical protein